MNEIVTLFQERNFDTATQRLTQYFAERDRSTLD